MGVSVPPEPDPVAAYNAKYGTSGKPPTASGGPDPVSSYNAKYGAKKSDAPMAQKIAETLVSGLPGATRAVAGYRGLVSLLSGEGIDAAADEVNNAMSEQKRDIASLPLAARLPLQLTGGAPLGAALAPLGVAGGGAAFGGLVGADQEAKSLKDRAKNVTVGAGFGVLGAKGGELVGKGVANVAARTGLTDFAANQIDKVAPNLAATMGTRGQVNAALSGRQDILDALGTDGQTAAKTQLDRIAKIRETAGVLYGKARQNVAPVQDPELQKLLNDPQVRQVFQAAAEIRDFSGNPLPKTSAPEIVPNALKNQGVSQERYDELMKLGASRAGTSLQRVAVNSGIDALPPELSGAKAGGVELPDPDVLARTKRYLQDAANGLNQTPLNINKDRARALLPKMDAIRSKLHEVSPEWKAADAYYADAKGQEEAFADGYDAVRHANSVNGGNLPENSPEAMLKNIETPRYPGEPPAAMSRRAEAFREGIKAFTADQVKDQTVDKGLGSVLGASALAPTEKAAQVRAIAMGSGPEANTVEKVLAIKRGASMSQAGGGTQNRIPVSPRGLVYAGVRRMVKPPDMIPTPEGQSYLAQALSSPQAQASEISRFRAGKPTSDAIKQALAISSSGAAARKFRPK